MKQKRSSSLKRKTDAPTRLLTEDVVKYQNEYGDG